MAIVYSQSNKGVSVLVDDQSIALSTNQLKTRFIVQAITERGVINEPYDVNNVLDFERRLGKAISNAGFEILRGLATNNCTFTVFPVHHSTAGTLQGTKATIDLASGVTINAKTVGSGYNGVTVAVTAPLSGKADVFDITVSLAGAITQTVFDVPETLNTDKVDELNQTFELVDFDISGGADLAIETVTLAGGAKDVSLVTHQDHINGVASFSKVKSFAPRMLQLHPAANIDDAFVAYAKQTNRTVHLFVPTSVTSKANYQAYRRRTTPYTGSKVDSFHARLVGGGLKVKHPYNANRTIQLLGGGDVAGAIGAKDRVGEFLAAAQSNFGTFSNAVDVVINFEGDDYNDLNAEGINLITNTDGLIRYDGNNTLHVDRTSNLKIENVADNIIGMQRYLFVLGQKYKYRQNRALSLWQPMYQEGRIFFDNLLNQGAIYAYRWNGDQDSQDPNLGDLVYNVPAEIESGIYRVQVIVRPTPAAEQITITITNVSGNITIS
jgi:hypothetical protein